jgi:hypothetical protein
LSDPAAVVTFAKALRIEYGLDDLSASSLVTIETSSVSTLKERGRNEVAEGTQKAISDLT